MLARARRFLPIVVLSLTLVGPSVFWRGGVLEREAATFIVQYTDGRGVWQKVLDPHANDWGTYQAREFSYLTDYIDATIFDWLARRAGFHLFIPVSAIVASLILAVAFGWAVRHTTDHIDSVSASLLWGCYATSFVHLSTMGLFYRSSKYLVASLLAVLVTYLRVVAVHAAPHNIGQPVLTAHTVVVFLLVTLAGMSDRQGAFYAVLGCVASCSYALTRHRHQDVAAGFLAAVAVLQLYNFALGPFLIHAVNGYWPSFAYQTLPREALLQLPLIALLASQMLVQNVVALLGGGWWVAGLVVIVGALLHLTRQDTVGPAVSGISRPLVRLAYQPDPKYVRLVLLVFGGHVLMFALMIARHPAIFVGIDHRYWYYPLPFVVILTFLALWALDGLMGGERAPSPLVWQTLLLVVMIGNLVASPRYRSSMLTGAWFGSVHAQSAILREALRGAGPRDALDARYRNLYEHLQLRVTTGNLNDSPAGATHGGLNWLRPQRLACRSNDTSNVHVVYPFSWAP